MIINRRAAFLLSIVLSACTGQPSPIVPTVEDNAIIVVPSATASPEGLPVFINTPQTFATTPASTPQSEQGTTLTPVSTLITSVTSGSSSSGNPSFIPITAPESAPTKKPGKFNNFNIDIPVTGFPPGVRTKINRNIPSSATLITPMLVIPALDVNIPIYGLELSNGTWDVSWLWDQAGWLEETAYPTTSGNSVITAHNVTADGKNGPFARLKSLTDKDYVFVVNSGFRYIYKVESNHFIEPNDVMSVFYHEEDPWLTLVTCDSYDEETGTYLLRVVVRTRLVEIQEMEK